MLLLLRSARHTGYGPVVLGVAGMALILVGRAISPLNTWPLLAGVLLFVSSSFLKRSPWATSTYPSRVS
jgi:hypothetical protein